MGSDYSDSDYQYSSVPSDDMDIGEFDSQHRLVGGKIEKYFQWNLFRYFKVELQAKGMAGYAYHCKRE